MTWLLAMKALLAGEISPEQFASPQYALGGGDECESDSGSEASDLPPGLRSLQKLVKVGVIERKGRGRAYHFAIKHTKETKRLLDAMSKAAGRMR